MVVSLTTFVCCVCRHFDRGSQGRLITKPGYLPVFVMSVTLIVVTEKLLPIQCAAEWNGCINADVAITTSSIHGNRSCIPARLCSRFHERRRLRCLLPPNDRGASRGTHKSMHREDAPILSEPSLS